MRKLLFAIACLALLSLPAFADNFNPADYTFGTTGGNGFVVTNAPSGFTLTGSNNAGGNNDTFYKTTIGGSNPTYAAFNWKGHSNDVDGFAFDPISIIRNGSTLVLLNGFHVYDASGSLNVALLPGDILKFNIHTTDGILGASVLTISNYNIPEPGTMALLGTGLLGLGFRRFRKS